MDVNSYYKVAAKMFLEKSSDLLKNRESSNFPYTLRFPTSEIPEIAFTILHDVLNYLKKEEQKAGCICKIARTLGNLTHVSDYNGGVLLPSRIYRIDQPFLQEKELDKLSLSDLDCFNRLCATAAQLSEENKWSELIKQYISDPFQKQTRELKYSISNSEKKVLMFLDFQSALESFGEEMTLYEEHPFYPNYEKKLEKKVNIEVRANESILNKYADFLNKKNYEIEENEEFVYKSSVLDVDDIKRVLQDTMQLLCL